MKSSIIAHAVAALTLGAPLAHAATATVETAPAQVHQAAYQPGNSQSQAQVTTDHNRWYYHVKP